MKYATKSISHQTVKFRVTSRLINTLSTGLQLIFAILLFSGTLPVYGQCIPEDCLDTLPDYGGVCEDETVPGRVNDEYFDSISFHITDACIDGSLLGFDGSSAIIVSMYDAEFSDLPVGVAGSFNEETYTPPANGCGYIEGVPQQAGLFLFNVSFKVDLDTWLFSTSCGGFLPPTLLTGEEIDLSVVLRILPDPSFAGLDTNVYCTTDSARTLIPLGTQGGIFSGPGVSGNQFDPAVAGPGLHPVAYSVTAMEGAAVEPESDSLVVWVEVIAPSLFYADMDGDGFGNPFESIFVCFPPEGYVDNDGDCDDSNPDVYPGAPNGPDGMVNDCNIITGVTDRALRNLEVFPNPATDRITIRGGMLNGPVQLSFFDVSGRLMYSETTFATGALQHDIQISDFGKGWYILHIGYQNEVERTGVVVR
jgi:hypothetical protein